MQQQTLAMAADQGAGFERYRRRTKREDFLDAMNAIVPWAELCAVIEPHYPKAGNGRRVYGDSAYASQKALIQGKAPHAQDFTNQRTRKAGCEIDEVKKAKNRNKSKIRPRVEHVFAVVKRLWGFDKVRYRGLAKNATRAFVTLAMANIYLARRPLLAQVGA